MVKKLKEKKHLTAKGKLHEAVEKATKLLQESEAKFRALAETTAAAIFIHQGGKFLYANPAGEAITGYTIDEVLKMDFWGLTHPDYRELIRERGNARLQGGQLPPRYEFKIVKKSGEERWVFMTAGVIEYEGKPAIIGTIFDITDRRQAEEEKARFYEESVRQYKGRIEEEKRHLMEKEKILMDLHDGIGGITTNISLLSELAQKKSSVTDMKKALSTISELSREGMSDIRSIMHSLDAKEITWYTMTAELRRHGSNMVESHGMSFDIKTSVEDMDEQPGSLLCLNIFRVYKEAIANIVKHSGAKSVNVNLNVSREKLTLAIRDDGSGLKGGRGMGRGISNMNARTKEMGGILTITSDNGTHIYFELPVPPKYPIPGMEL